jgi:glyoxylase-like metal-dependent hydrolase (beta-lactamase superfamily II)
LSTAAELNDGGTLKKRVAVTLLLLTLCSTAWTQDFNKIQVRATSVRGNIHLLQANGGNIVVSSGNDGTLIVDDEYAPMTDKVRAAISALTKLPVKFVINTHWHNDHTGGNEAFGLGGALIIAHENSAKRMASDQVMSLYGPQAAYQPVGQPKSSFDKSMRLRWNDDTIDLVHLGPAHTDGDAIVFFRKQNVVCTGDLFVGGAFRPPYFDDLNGGSTEGMINAVIALADLIDENTIIVPGHGDLARRADVIEYRSMLMTVRDRIKREIALGRSEDEAVATKPLAEFARPGKGTDRWVRIAYREYRTIKSP